MPTTAPLASLAAVPVRLRCEGIDEPLGIDVTRPRLSWMLRAECDEARAVRQAAYRVVVATSRDALDRADVWDSGRVASAKTRDVEIGAALASTTAYAWRVQAWSADGDETGGWSEPASFTTGLLTPGEWSAQWIQLAAEPQPATIEFRRAIAVRPGLRSATLHVCGLGQYVLRVNGERHGTDVTSPGWTNYRATCLYDTRDVLPLLRAGENELTLSLGGGMYHVPGGRYAKFKQSFGPLKAIAQLHLAYADGRREVVGTDAAWHARPGAATFCCMFGGEDVDARRDEPWTDATVSDGPGGALRGACSAATPVTTHERFAGRALAPISPTTRVYDFGQNASIVPALAVRGPRGSRVRLTPAELVGKDGRVDRRSCGGGSAFWEYTLRGDADGESWTPDFFYHGSRYAQADVAPAELGDPLPEVDALTAVVVHTAADAIGTFECSSDLFNRTYALIRWAQRSNLMSVITDCPHRERLGWLEQYHLNGPSLRYNFDLARLYGKCFQDMADAQTKDGLVPDIAPEYVQFNGGFRDSPEWGSALILAARQQYLFAGDLEPFRRHWSAMRRYVDYLASKSKGELLDHGLGDWYDVGPKPPGKAQLTPVKLTASAIFYEDLRALAEAAAMVGKDDEAKEFAARADRVKAAFNAAMFDATKGSYATGSQTSNAMPLVLGLVPDDRRDDVLRALVADVQKHDAVTAGDVGFRYLLRALADGGRHDLIFTMNHQADRPGYGSILARGATALTEAWDARPDSSQNHFMLGQIMEWFFHDLAGIQPDPAEPGFAHVVIRPAIVGDLTHVRATHRGPFGEIVSAWRRNGEALRFDVTIPPNSRATLHVLAAADAAILEGGRPIDRTPGVDSVRREDRACIFDLRSGTYAISVG